jgi:ABC-type sugar transport system ATPase subunit
MSAGHQTLSEGDILIGDVNVTDLPPAKRGTAMMFQSYALFPHLTCVDNVAFSLKMRGVDKAKRREQAMGEHNALPMELQALTTTVTTTAVSFAVIADALGAIAVLRKRQARHGSDAGQA